MTQFFVDLSNNNWGGPAWTPEGERQLIGFLAQLRQSGIDGVVHKVSQGSSFRDPYWRACRSWCESNDLSWLGYAYLSTDDPAAQAQAFVDNDGGPNAMMDWENGGGDLSNLWSVINAFNAAGVNVSLAYCPRWYWAAQGYGDLSSLPANQISLVSSAYPGGTGAPADIYANAGGDRGEGFDPYGGCTPAVWQFTDRASIGGITVDCNAYRGDNLDALFTGNIF